MLSPRSLLVTLAAMGGGKPWTRDELMLVMHLYFQMPFSRFTSRTPEIVAMASQLGRTPSSVAMKLCNLASFDSTHQARGVVGLRGASRLDREVWDAWQRDLTGAALKVEEELLPKHQRATEAQRVTTERLGQEFFRRSLLTAYDGACALTGLDAPELLRASHIVPWSEREDLRLDPRNGLCLAATLDAAFDRHLVTFDDDLRLVVGSRLRSRFRDSPSIRDTFAPLEGHALRRPSRTSCLPDPRWLAVHRARLC